MGHQGQRPSTATDVQRAGQEGNTIVLCSGYNWPALYQNIQGILSVKEAQHSTFVTSYGQHLDLSHNNLITTPPQKKIGWDPLFLYTETR